MKIDATSGRNEPISDIVYNSGSAFCSIEGCRRLKTIDPTSRVYTDEERKTGFRNYSLDLKCPVHG